MIKTATQLKAKVQNLSGSDSTKAQTLIRNYIMERFLERIALSKYRNNFILKGGMLVASVVGLDTRTTKDIDTAITSMDLSMESAINIVKDIIAIELSDEVNFSITKVVDIMEEHDYPGIRFIINATLGKMQQNFKIDISTGDVITPGAVEYTYPLMFEDRTISLWTYNLETLMAEKLETIMSRGTTNTRMRDFYDIHIISINENIDYEVFKRAFLSTSEKRGTKDQIPNLWDILQTVEADATMIQLWNNYRDDSFFVGDLSWNEVIKSVKMLAENVHGLLETLYLTSVPGMKEKLVSGLKTPLEDTVSEEEVDW